RRRHLSFGLGNDWYQHTVLLENRGSCRCDVEAYHLDFAEAGIRNQAFRKQAFTVRGLVVNDIPINNI
ncbi:MAG: hypothetical protein ABIQ24_01685, partial [Nitrospiraceae bacterium]